MPRQSVHPSRSGNRPLYAIDFTAVACGKRIANTKRRVRWRFGFANPDALASGETGTACRGEEHDVTLVWSVTSGKRLILADGQEVHYSNSRSAVIDFSWTMRGNHVLKVVAHATAPMSADPGFRQYDFFVDGRSFFSFPKVYRLGLTGNKTASPDQVPNRARSGGGGGGGGRLAESSGRRKSSDIRAIETPHNQDEEEAYLRQAIQDSLETEAKRKEGEKTPEKPKMSAEATDLLIDFMDDFDATGSTVIASPASAEGEWALAPAANQPANQWAAPPPAQPDQNWAMAAATTAQPAPAAVQQPAYDQYGRASSFSAAPAPSPFAPAPAAPRHTVADPFGAPGFAQPPPAPTAMVDSFSPQPPAPTQLADAFAPQPPVAAPAPFPVPPTEPPAVTTNGSGSGAVLTMNSLSSDGGLLSGGAPGQAPSSPSASSNMAGQALQNLMTSIDNFGLTGAAAKPPAANNPFDSNNIMSNATLGEIKTAKAENEKKPVMNAPPGQGAMVMASNQGGNWGGYGGQQYGGMGGGMQQQAPQYPMSGGYPQQQQMGYGQQPPMQQQQPAMGQQPPMQQGYGAPQYGQQPPMQQNQWGAPSY